MTYNVFGGTLSLTQSINQSTVYLTCSVCCCVVYYATFRCYWYCIKMLFSGIIFVPFHYFLLSAGNGM